VGSGLILSLGLDLGLGVVPSLELILGPDLNRDLMVGLGLGLGLWVDSLAVILGLVLVMICLSSDVL
jgi:hypothetical protein